jgi:hypothetical protein
MSLHPDLEGFLIRSRIADVQREAALRHLVRQAKPARPGNRAAAVVRRLVRAASVIWPSRRIERTVLR